MKKLLIIITILYLYSCTNVIKSTSNKNDVKLDMTNYLETLHGESFYIKTINRMANVANPGTKNLYELVCYPVKNPNLLFDARVGYNKNDSLFVIFEYYKTVKLSLQANDYAQDIIKKYYSDFASYCTIDGIHTILDKHTNLELTYKDFINEYPENLETRLYIAILKNSANEELHKENLRNIFRDYEKKKHLNIAIDFGFYKNSVKDSLNTFPKSFFDPSATPTRKFTHKKDLKERWKMDLTKGIMSNSEIYLNKFERFLQVRKY